MLHARMLRYLDEVARSGSIRKAATKLNVSSTAINRQIIALEQELGEPLFERMPRKLRLTAAGEVLIEHVRKTLKDFTRAQQSLNALKGVQRGEVTFSTTLGLLEGPMAKVALDFIEKHPRVQIRLRGMTAEGILGSILSGDVSLGLGFNIRPHAGLRTLFSINVPFGAVVGTTHPLADRQKVRLADLLAFPMVLAEREMNLRTIIELAFSRVGHVPRPIIETNSVGAMKQVVRNGDAITLLNPIDVAADCAQGLLVYLPLAEQNLQPQTLKLITRVSGTLDSPTSLFVEHLRNEILSTDGLAEENPEPKGTTPTPN